MQHILFIIDHFGSGGAQRQILSLATGLFNRGHKVEFFNYYPEHNFFRHEVEQRGILIHDYPKEKKGFSLKTLLSLRKLLKNKRYDVAVAFLDTPAIYLLLAGLGIQTKLVVSDRSSHMRFNKYTYTAKRQLFRIADDIVANSHTQVDWLVQGAKLSGKKVFSIYNGYDCDKFHYSPNIPESAGQRSLKFIGIGRINPVKNFENLIRALDIFHAKNGWCPELTWVGRSNSPDYENKVLQLLDSFPHVKKNWVWAGQRNDIPQLLAEHHALILPSLYEGLPNVVCEAMLAGKPVLVSNVCDHPILVENGKRGFLFDPQKPDDIAQAIQRLINLSGDEWKIMSQNAHDYAKGNLSLDRMVSEYENLFDRLLFGKKNT